MWRSSRSVPRKSWWKGLIAKRKLRVSAHIHRKKNTETENDRPSVKWNALFSRETPTRAKSAAAVKFSCRWCKQLRCRPLSWSCCNQAQKLPSQGNQTCHWKPELPLTHLCLHAETQTCLWNCLNMWFGCTVVNKALWQRLQSPISLCTKARLRPQIWSHLPVKHSSLSQWAHRVPAHHDEQHNSPEVGAAGMAARLPQSRVLCKHVAVGVVL